MSEAISGSASRLFPDFALLIRATVAMTWKRPSNTLMHLTLVADRAEMLVDAKHDQDEFRGDARKHDPDDHAGDRGQQQDESAERADRHRCKAGKNPGNAEQRNQRDDQPVKGLDDGGCDKTVPLKQIPKIKHRLFSRRVEYELRPNLTAYSTGPSSKCCLGQDSGTSTEGRCSPAEHEPCESVG